MNLPIHRTIGIALICIGVAPFAYVLLRLHSENWQPLNVALKLFPGEYRSPEFKTDRDGRYIVKLAFDRLADIVKQQCLMGVALGNSSCQPQSGVIDFEWQVVSGNTVVSSGAYSPRSVSGTEVTFADFQGSRGKHQRLVLNIKRDSGELNGANPHLLVQAGPEYSEGNIDYYRYSLLWAIVIGGTGFLCILFPLLFRKAVR
jgi:hypothetical protein